MCRHVGVTLTVTLVPKPEMFNDQTREVQNSKGGHPAKFSAPILNRIVAALECEVQQRRDMGFSRTLSLKVLDPFAGVGGIHRIIVDGVKTYAIEIESEWANESMKLGETWCGDFFSFIEPSHDAESSYDVVCTSPTYGNRMADHHEARDGSRRISYRHRLGRALSENNSGKLQWGDEYRNFHTRAWAHVNHCLKPSGLFILNISDHIRQDSKQPVAAWHGNQIKRLGFKMLSDEIVETRRHREGENSKARVNGEHVIMFRKVASCEPFTR